LRLIIIKIVRLCPHASLRLLHVLLAIHASEGASKVCGRIGHHGIQRVAQLGRFRVTIGGSSKHYIVRSPTLTRNSSLHQLIIGDISAGRESGIVALLAIGNDGPTIHKVKAIGRYVGKKTVRSLQVVSDAQKAKNKKGKGGEKASR
jgi:hypothetical protein